MTKANESAFPRKEECIVGPNQRMINEHGGVSYYPGQTYLREHPGLTKRELFAAMAMQNMATHWYPEDDDDLRKEPARVAAIAVNYADALLKELEKETK